MKMFRVSYEINRTINQSTFKTEEEAMNFVNSNADIRPLKLLVWDNEIDCYSTLKEFNKVSKNATATSLFKRIYA